MPNFEVLDAKIASALNRIIHNSHFKRRVSLEEQKAQKEDRFLRVRQIAFMIYDYFRVYCVRDTVLDYADLFSVTLHVDNIQDFDTRWDEVRLSLSKTPSDDFLESLYKLRIREFAQLKTVLKFHDMEIHQKISMPNDQKLKTMVDWSIDQKLRLRNIDARHGSSQESKRNTRHMTDNIFEIESTALAHVACAPQDSGVLLTDFAAAYPSVNHSWIFSVLENTGLPDFLCRFLRSIYRDNITYVELAGAKRGQFQMARGVRHDCPASGFLFCIGL